MTTTEGARREQDLIEALVSPRTGIINAVQGPYAPLGLHGMWAYRAHVGTVRADLTGARLGGGAVAWDRKQALTATLAESVERYVWSQPSGRPEMLAAKEIARNGLRPRDFGVPLEAGDRTRADAVGNGENYPWLAGRDLLSGRTRWAPAGTVVIGYQHPPNHGYDCDHTTTGMAVGPGAAAALIAGATEVIERDAYMITHLNRLRLPEIDLDTSTDRYLRTALDQLATSGSMHIRAWDMTLDAHVPTVLSAALIQVDGAPAVRIAAAAHPSARRAIRKACAEAIQCLALLDHDEVRHRRASTTADSAPLDNLHDHVGLGDFPEYVEALDWLLYERPRLCTAQEVEIDHPADGGREQLRWLAHRLRGSGFHAYGFDLTPTDLHASTGFHIWRVIIPGMQRLTTGRRPATFTDRVRGAPVHAGLRETPITAEETNPLPHCFP